MPDHSGTEEDLVESLTDVRRMVDILDTLTLSRARRLWRTLLLRR